MRKWLLGVCVSLSIVAAQNGYKLGNGLKISDALTVGGYFATEYEDTSKEQTFLIDDIAFLGYGNFSDQLSYLLELEAVTYYKKNFTTKKEEHNPKFHYERAYFDYKSSDALNFRLGRQISPIGYWNLEPINVLRDTSSNPVLSKQFFPKFLSGLDIYGYLPSFEATKYHFFMQKNRDLDEEYLNIATDHFFGASLETEVSDSLSVGGSLGEFITRSDDKSRFLMFNFKYDSYPFITQMEAVVRYTDYNNGTKEDTSSTYLQSMYRFNEQHAVVGRYEHIHDELNVIQDDIGILGYSYRPLYPVSLKGEYQWHRDSTLNKFLFSFSVLF
jgi:hypothetical protein